MLWADDWILKWSSDRQLEGKPRVEETCKMCHETSLCDPVHSPLFHCSTCNSPSEASSTCQHRRWCSITPLPLGIRHITHDVTRRQLLRHRAPATTTNRRCQPGQRKKETRRRATRRRACTSSDTNARQSAFHIPHWHRRVFLKCRLSEQGEVRL